MALVNRNDTLVRIYGAGQYQDRILAGSGSIVVGSSGQLTLTGTSGQVILLTVAGAAGRIDFSQAGVRATFAGTIGSDGEDAFRLRDTTVLGWASGDPTSTALDTMLRREAADVLAQRRSTNVQEARWYGTFTSTTNYQRLALRCARTTLSALSGATATATGLIPDGAVLIGLTTRVTTALTGADGYQVGDGVDADRWGNVTGTAAGTGTHNADWTATTIQAFTSANDVVLTANTSNFTAGTIQICAFYFLGEFD